MALSKPRILFYSENTVASGSERYLHDLAGGLADRHYDIGICCNSHPDLVRYHGSIRDELVVKALPVMTPGNTGAARLGERAGGHDARYLKHIWPIGAMSIRTIQFCPNLAILYRWIRQCAPDILQINNGGYPGGETCRTAAIAGKLAGVPVVCMAVHNLAVPYRTPVLVEAAFDRVICRSVDAVLAFSYASANTLIRGRGFSRDKVAVIPYGIAVPPPLPRLVGSAREELGLPAKGLLVGAVGRLEPRKGQNYLIEAAAAVIREVHDIHFIIVGSGPSEVEYRARADELGIGARVIFTGQRSDVSQLLRAFDIFAMPSVDYESLPFALLEAMSAGLPIIGTRVAGIPEALQDGESGLLVHPRDVAALAAAVLRLVSDPGARATLGAAANARARAKFEITRMLDETEEFYRFLLRSTKYLSSRAETSQPDD